MSKDYYNLLGLDKSASADQIKAAYRKLAHQHHPDKGGDAEKFKEINEAYQVLGNEEKRKQYDQFGSAAFNNGAGGFNWQNFNQGGQGMNFDFEDLGDMFGGFGDMFGFGGGRSRASAARSGRDMEMLLTIDFSEAIFGAEKEISYSRQVVCPTCGGSGGDPKTKPETCKTCGGRGRVARVQRTILGSIQTESICPDCSGEGKIYPKSCPECSGRGQVKENTKIKVKIPAGIDNGESIRLQGRGEAGAKGGRAGDLFLRLQVKPHRHLKREGDNIFSQEEISVKQAILGGKIEVETVDGNITLKIPAGTQPDTVFRIKDHGSYHLHGHGRGDHLVNIKVKIPKSLNRQAEKLLEQLEF